MANSGDRKKRRWSVKRVVLLLIAVFVLWLGWQVWDIFTGKPVAKVDYARQFHELSLSVQPGEGENGYALFCELIARADEEEMKLVAGIVLTPEESVDPDNSPSFSSLLTGPYRAHRWPRQMKSLNELRKDGTFDRISRLAGMPRCEFPLVTATPFWEAYSSQSFHRYGPLRDFTKMMGARMRIASHEGNWTEFNRVLDNSLAVIQLASHQPSLINFLVVMACHDLVFGELRLALVENALDVDTSNAVRESFERHLPLPSAEFYMAGENLFARDMFQSLYTTSGRMPADTFQFDKDDLESTLASAASIVIPGYTQAIEISDQIHDRIIRLSSLALTDILAAGESEPPISVPFHLVLSTGTQLDPNQIASIFAMHQANVSSTRIMLALEMYQANRDGAPVNLQALVPEFLDAFPADPVTGGNYGYRRMISDPHGREYLLWSFGADGVDNGGVQSEGNHWLDDTPGTDRVINDPRFVPEGIKS